MPGLCAQGPRDHGCAARRVARLEAARHAAAPVGGREHDRDARHHVAVRVQHPHGRRNGHRACDLLGLAVAGQDPEGRRRPRDHRDCGGRGRHRRAISIVARIVVALPAVTPENDATYVPSPLSAVGLIVPVAIRRTPEKPMVRPPAVRGLPYWSPGLERETQHRARSDRVVRDEDQRGPPPRRALERPWPSRSPTWLGPRP